VTQEIIKAVKEVEGVLDFKVEGNTILAKVVSSDTTPLLTTNIVTSGGRLKRVGERTISLEDVFLKLTE